MSEMQCPHCKGQRVNITVSRADGAICHCTSCGSEWVWNNKTLSIDHKELLIKYIQHVNKMVGSNQITNCSALPFSPIDIQAISNFTPEEWAELEALALIARERE